MHDITDQLLGTVLWLRAEVKHLAPTRPLVGGDIFELSFQRCVRKHNIHISRHLRNHTRIMLLTATLCTLEDLRRKVLCSREHGLSRRDGTNRFQNGCMHGGHIRTNLI